MTRLSKERWIESGLAALADAGHDAVRVELLAGQLGVTKGSFYWHFKSRRELLDAMLSRWEAAGTDLIIEHVTHASPPPREQLERLLKLAAGPTPHAGLDVQLRAWGATDPSAAAAINRVDAKRIAFVAGLLRGLGLPAKRARLRSEALYRMLIGEYTIQNAGGRAATPALFAEILAIVTALPNP